MTTEEKLAKAIKALEYYAHPFTYGETTNARMCEVMDEDIDFCNNGKADEWWQKKYDPRPRSEAMWSTRNAGKLARKTLMEIEAGPWSPGGSDESDKS